MTKPFKIIKDMGDKQLSVPKAIKEQIDLDWNENR